MARTFPRGLSNLLARNVGIATHSTLELRIPSEITANQNYYFATAKLEIDGVTYDRQLRETGNVRTSLTRASDRVTVDLQNVDTVLGVSFLELADALYGAEARFGRLWTEKSSGAKIHKILLTGVVAGVQILESVVRLELVSEGYAGTKVGAYRPVRRNCAWQELGRFRGTECGYSGAELTCNGLLDDSGGCHGRHGSPLKRAKFGGFVYIESAASVAGAAALPTPSNNQLIKTTDGTTNTSYAMQPFLALTAGSVAITNNATDEQTEVNILGNVGSINAKSAQFGALANGSANDTTAIANALTAANSQGRPLYLPAGTYMLDELDWNNLNSIRIFGDGPGRTILKSRVSNKAVIDIDCTSTVSHTVQIENLSLEGYGGSGTSANHGIYIHSSGNEPFNVMISNVRITNTGGRAVYFDTGSGSAFNVRIADVHATNWNLAATSGVPAFDIDTNGPCVHLLNCYAHDTTSSNPIAYRFRRGQTRTILMEGCNGIDPSGSGSVCVIVGQDTTYGDASNSVAYVSFLNCNFEAFQSTGIEVRGSGSVINLLGANNFVKGANGVRPIRFRTATIANCSPGILDPQTIFADADSAGTAYANGEPIESEGNPPLICIAPAGQFGTYNGCTTYWDTSLATDKSVPLRRLDVLNRVAPTATYTVESQGTRLVDMRHSGAGVTVTLMYGGYLRPGEWVVVKDGSGIAATHNITVNAGGGSTIDGAASATINTNYGSLLVYSDGTNYLTFGGGNSSGGGSGANTALSNLASVAINTSLLPGTDNAIDAGSSSKQFRNGYFGTGIVMGNGATTYAAQNLTITAGSNPQYAFSDGTVSGRFQLLGGSYLQIGTTTNHDTLFLHNGTGVFSLRAVGLIPEATNTYQFGGSDNRWTDGFFSGSLNLKERSAPSTPSADTLVIYPKAKGSTSGLYYKNDAGTEYELGGNVPYCEVEASGTQSISNSTLTYIDFATEIADTDTMHDTVTNNSRITATTAGKYIVTATVPWDDLGGAQFRILTRIYKNRTDVVAGVDYVLPNVTSQFPSFNVSGMVNLSAGDYVEVAVYHERGSTKDTYNSSGLKPKFSAVRVSA